MLTSTVPDGVTGTLPAQLSVAVAPGSDEAGVTFDRHRVSAVDGDDGRVVSTILIITSSESEPPPVSVTVSVMVCGPDGSETLSVAPVPSVVAPSFQV